MTWTLNLRDELSATLDKLCLLDDAQFRLIMSELSDSELMESSQKTDEITGEVMLVVRPSPKLQDAINAAALRKALVHTTIA